MRGTARKSAPKDDRATNQVDDLMQFYSEAYTEVYPRGKSGTWFGSESRLIIHQSKHAAAVLGNAKSHAASIPCTKASTQRGFWTMT